jgi:hypothetical protein
VGGTEGNVFISFSIPGVIVADGAEVGRGARKGGVASQSSKASLGGQVIEELIKPSFDIGIGIYNLYQAINPAVFLQVRLVEELGQLGIDLVSQVWDQLGQ